MLNAVQSFYVDKGRTSRDKSVLSERFPIAVSFGMRQGCVISRGCLMCICMVYYER